jgi:general secretion pathway protein G
MMIKKHRQAGFTLIELLVVLMIIGLLAALVGPNLMKRGEQGKVSTAKAQIQMLNTALDMFKLDVGRYPNSQEGLTALVQNPGGTQRWDGPYLRQGKEVPLDPWEHPYVYRSPGEKGAYDLLSYGADGVAGGQGENADVSG